MKAKEGMGWPEEEAELAALQCQVREQMWRAKQEEELAVVKPGGNRWRLVEAAEGDGL